MGSVRVRDCVREENKNYHSLGLEDDLKSHNLCTEVIRTVPLLVIDPLLQGPERRLSNLESAQGTCYATYEKMRFISLDADHKGSLIVWQHKSLFFIKCLPKDFQSIFVSE